MLSSSPARLWVLVTDGHRARIAVPEDAEGRFRTNRVLGVVEHPYCPPSLRHGAPEAAHAQFVADVARRLNEAAAEDEYDRLLLIAPRLIADPIRHALTTAAQARVVAVLDHDYAALADGALSERLARWWLPSGHAAEQQDDAAGGMLAD